MVARRHARHRAPRLSRAARARWGGRAAAARGRDGRGGDGRASTSSSPPPKSLDAATSRRFTRGRRDSSSAGRGRSTASAPRTSWSSRAAASPAGARGGAPGAPASRPKVIVDGARRLRGGEEAGVWRDTLRDERGACGLGILEDLRASNTRSCAHWTFKDDGAVLGYFGLAFLPEERKAKTNGVTNLRFPPSSGDLTAAVAPGTVRFGCRVVDYEEVTNDDTSSSVPW